ncbi:Bug family tripartite tricarboxylate transporter substrate binding protein [Phreatobacter stygius]|uniref:Tripartite tricarboxylate transporter substrate binding protein n=1 Tax=Phreatobacter stygius TaxID=1940610 RepID=A0A4D7BDC2_9HYPH|nr:tripartite tricarboxylate transporter substrate binding protein [Phreatobacter stygius]QCI68573.1 tripartite tricarboxylate transporter substrate binding protein [Phreatobacter stygius]
MPKYPSRRHVLIGAGAIAVSGRRAQAADYPTRPVQIVVPYAPGGTTDIIARIVAQKLTEVLKQSFVIMNRPGAGGAIGSEFGAKQPADGYSLVMAVESSHAVNPNVYKERRYDPVRDFAAISNLAEVPNVLVVGPEFPGRDFASFLAELKAKPGHYHFGSSGIGGLSHMNGELFMHVTGTKLQHVPYRGLGPALTDLIGGRIGVLFDNIPSSAPFIEAGRIAPLAVAFRHRLDILPQVPTYAELGLPAMNNPSWFGIAAPAGTPAPIIEVLNGAIRAVLAAKDVVEAIGRQGAVPAPTSAAEFSTLIADQDRAWKKIVDDINFAKL